MEGFYNATILLHIPIREKKERIVGEIEKRVFNRFVFYCGFRVDKVRYALELIGHTNEHTAFYRSDSCGFYELEVLERVFVSCVVRVLFLDKVESDSLESLNFLNERTFFSP